MNSKIKTIRKAISTGILSIILTNCIPMDTYYSYSKDINGDKVDDKLFFQSTKQDSLKDTNNLIKWDDYEITFKKGTRANRHKVTYGPETSIALFYRKPNRIEFVDLNDDNQKDILYTINKGERKTKEGMSYEPTQYDYAIAIRINNGENGFSEEKILRIIPDKPERLRLKYDENNLPDIIFLYDTQTNIDTTGDKKSATYNDFKLERIVNKGNGEFKEAELINTYPKNPNTR